MEDKFNNILELILMAIFLIITILLGLNAVIWLFKAVFWAIK